MAWHRDDAAYVLLRGKAAPIYRFAKLSKFINNLAGTIDGDPIAHGRLKVVFLPGYCVSLGERLIPAADMHMADLKSYPRRTSS